MRWQTGRAHRQGLRPSGLYGSQPRPSVIKDELLKAVWPGSYVEESNLSQNVFVVRKVLGSDGEGVIQTLPGRGYLFTAHSLAVGLPSGSSAAHGVAFETTETRIVFEENTEDYLPFWKSPITLGFASTAMILLGVAGWLGWQRYEDHVGGPPVQVVIADLDGSSGEAVLDRTLSTVLRIEMAQSPFVTVLSQSTVRSTLALMLLKPDDHLTTQVANDVCERTNSQAVLHLAVARAGSRYLLTEEATDCADGSSLATARQEVKNVDDLPQAIMKNGASIRHSLGESRRMIARFNQPLLPVSAGATEALKDYSQAAYLGAHGRFPESVQLLKHAISIDPNFAAAYLNLGVFSNNMADTSSVKLYLQKAYDLRQFATEPIKLFIVAFYHQEITGDLDESVRNYKTWIELYPKQAQPWSGMGEAYRLMGNYQEATEANQRTLQILPTQAIVYYALANAQMRNHDYAAALATCRLGISRNLDNENLRLTLLRLGLLQHDATSIAEQEEWLKQHPDSPIFLLNEANIAESGGRIKDAQAFYYRALDVYRRQGATSAATSFTMEASADWVALDELDLAKKYLGSAPIETNFSDLLALAELGELQRAESLLHDYLAAHPQSTLWNKRYAPFLRGEFALLGHKPQEAVALMAPSRQLDNASLDGYYLRGKADMQANKLAEAEAEFRALLAHPFIEPAAVTLTLAQLQLARTFALEGKNSASIASYQLFLLEWKDADADAPLLIQARDELQKLEK